MADNYEERTEQATPKRREKAREKGDVPISRDLLSLVSLWVAFVYFTFTPSVVKSMGGYLRRALARSFSFPLTAQNFTAVVKEDSQVVALILLPLLIVIAACVLLVHFVQTNFLITFEPLKMDPNRLNPVEGVKRLFSLNTLFQAFKGFAKIIVFGVVLYLLLKKEVFRIPQLVGFDVPSLTGYSLAQVKKLFFVSVIVLTVFAVIDIGYTRWEYERKLRMTRQEVKEEFREMEGDPMVKARIRSLLRELARRRMMEAVPTADFVVTNPTHIAVALKYDETKHAAPVVVAKGANLLAERIKEIARKNDVPIFEDRPLARALYKLDVGQEIPEMLYRAVAAILAQVYRMKGKVRRGGDA
ncbi:MAG: flagellar biosynthesis protein FlhB [Deltaproteobacteria bacterium]|nr:MAG: flagellar biosynthesis protein FlhB [Deltaproteobacteria bacterium]